MTPQYLHFTNRKDFDIWHKQVRQELGLPRIGFNAETGRQAPDKQPTTDYVEAEEHPTSKALGIICRVDMSCPEKLRNQTAEKTHKLTRKESASLEKEGWFKDRITPLKPPSNPTTKTKA